MRLLLCITTLILASSAIASSQECGKTGVKLAAPEYYSDAGALFAIQPPQGWVRDSTEKTPFFLVKEGENFKTTKSLIYVAVEPLRVSFEEAVQNDAESFGSNCGKLDIEDLKRQNILEKGCKTATQVFACTKTKGSHSDLDTKIAINGLLRNVALTSDTREDLAKYKSAYDFLLMHIARVN